MSGTKNLGAYIPSSPAVWLENGELRIEWRHLFTQLWERTGGSQGSPPASGTITGVTAGAGLSGGGTTGTVTISLTIPVTIGNGGTGATTAAQALMNLGALPVAGGTMTGALTLAADPASALQPVTLQYYNAHTTAPPAPATAAPAMDGTAAVGTSLLYARQDHVHPSDTSRLALAGGTMTGAVALAGVSTAPTAAAGANSTQIATTAYADNLNALTWG